MATQAKSDTARLDAESVLVRNGWIKEGMAQSASKSFWSPYKGGTMSSVIYQKQQKNADEGHTIIFDFDGNYTTYAATGDEKAYGSGGAKPKFSDKLTAEELRYPISNGKKFKGKEIGNLAITQHGNARKLLSDMWVRNEDQFFFDAGCGFLRGEAPTHIIRPNGKATVGDLLSTDVMSYSFLLDLEEVIKTGEGYTVGGKRAPILPVTFEDGEAVWILVVDVTAKNQLFKDSEFQTIVRTADVRGRNNMLLKGQIGRVGSWLIVEAPLFFGKTKSNQLGKTAAERSGMRLVDEDGYFSGTTSFGASGKIIASRCFVLGQGAFQQGIGMDPDYAFQKSDDFGNTSESALEWWGQVQKTNLKAELEDYEEAKIANMDFGMCVVDVYNRTVA
jgi:hypothetical protein